MATKSFIKEFAVNKRNAGSVLRALSVPGKEVILTMDKRVDTVKKESLKSFFGLDRNK